MLPDKLVPHIHELQNLMEKYTASSISINIAIQFSEDAFVIEVQLYSLYLTHSGYIIVNSDYH